MMLDYDHLHRQLIRLRPLKRRCVPIQQIKSRMTEKERRKQILNEKEKPITPRYRSSNSCLYATVSLFPSSCTSVQVCVRCASSFVYVDLAFVAFNAESYMCGSVQVESMLMAMAMA